MEILEKFLSLKSKPEVFSVLNDQCRQLGFDYCIYSPLLVDGGAEKIFKDESKIMQRQALMAQNTFADCPIPWLNRYQQARHVDKDPVIKHVARSVVPIVWEEASQANPANIVFGEAREHGLGHGITVSVFGHGGQRALLSMSATHRPASLREQRAVTSALVQLTANYAYEAVQKIDSLAQDTAIPVLTMREKDCLQWAAGGKTSWEIAHILHISERTVIFHLGNAGKKLGAANRRQAVVRALSLRLINP